MRVQEEIVCNKLVREIFAFKWAYDLLCQLESKSFFLSPLRFSSYNPTIFKIPKLALVFYFKRALWMSCFATVLLLLCSLVALVEAHISYVKQGEGVGCVAEVLVSF